MIETYLSDSSRLPDPLAVPEKLDTLTCSRAEKIRRIRHLETRKQSFGAGLLLNYAFLQQSGQGSLPAKMEYECNAYGKPVSVQAAFNISHTGSYVIVSMDKDSKTTESRPSHKAALPPDNRNSADICIGCDIEQIKTYQPKTARRFFTETEYACLESIPKPSQAEQFCRFWTRKESVMKLTGLGMALPMDLFDISRKAQIVPDRIKFMAWQAAQAGQNPEYARALDLLLYGKIFFMEYVHKNSCITVCSTIDQFAPDISYVPIEEFLFGPSFPKA